MIVIAGPNGSGKTSLTNQLQLHQWFNGCAYINADNMAQNVFGDWNSPQSVLSAARLADEQRKKCLALKQSLAFETVLSTPEKNDFLQMAHDSGYFIRLFFVGTSHPSINAARVAIRFLEGGHSVPIPKIISRYSKSIANCAVAASIADRSYVFDNSIDNRQARLIFRTRAGKIVKFYAEVPTWAQIIVNTLSGSTKIIESNGASPTEDEDVKMNYLGLA
jgi:predicted ABC-type ATPase